MLPKPGEVYRHFKGKHYRVITVARHSENSDEQLVIYQSIDEPERIWARPLTMWTEEVNNPEYNNYNGPRFKLIKTPSSVNNNQMKNMKLQSVLFEITLIFLVISNFAIFQMAEVGSYGYMFKIFSIVLLALLVLDLGMRIGKR